MGIQVNFGGFFDASIFFPAYPLTLIFDSPKKPKMKYQLRLRKRLL